MYISCCMNGGLLDVRTCKIKDIDERIEVITFLQGNENECIETMYESHHWNFRLANANIPGNNC